SAFSLAVRRWRVLTLSSGVGVGACPLAGAALRSRALAALCSALSRAANCLGVSFLGCFLASTRAGLRATALCDAAFLCLALTGVFFLTTGFFLCTTLDFTAFLCFAIACPPVG